MTQQQNKPQMVVQFVSVIAPKDWNMKTEQGEMKGTSYKANVVVAETGETLQVKLSEEVWKSVASYKLGQHVLLTFDIRVVQRQLIAVVTGVEAVQAPQQQKAG